MIRFIERNKDKSAIEYANLCFELAEFWEKIEPVFEKYDILLTPAVAVPPFDLGGYGPREIAGEKAAPLDWMAFSYPFNITGQPAASVPCGWTEGDLPIGLQIVGRRFDDVTVLRAAAAFEQAFPWTNRQPTNV